MSALVFQCFWWM